MFGQWSLHDLLVHSETKKNMKIICTSSYEFDSQLCTLEVEACWGMVLLIEKITINSDGRLNEAEIFWAM